MIRFKQQSCWVLLFTCAFNQEEKERFGGGKGSHKDSSWVAYVAGAKRGGEGEGEQRERGEKGSEPLPSLPNPLHFPLLPYPVPLSTPATQATHR